MTHISLSASETEEIFPYSEALETPQVPLEHTPRQKTVLEEAQSIIHGPRREAYGHPKKNFGDIAKMWEVILRVPVTSAQVGLCMIAQKMCRENNSHQRDNLTDIAGFAGCIDLLGETT